MHVPAPTIDCPASDRSSLPRGAVALFAAAAGMSVANIYYAQPLLDTLAVEFSISRAAIGGVVSATQAGCAVALLLLVPLGDLVERRRLILVQALLLVMALVIVALSGSAAMLLAAIRRRTVQARPELRRCPGPCVDTRCSAARRRYQARFLPAGRSGDCGRH